MLAETYATYKFGIKYLQASLNGTRRKKSCVPLVPLVIASQCS